jgi:hypothetical protein
VLSVVYETLVHLFSTLNCILFLQFTWQLDQYAKIVANIGRGYFCKNKILWVYCSIVKSPEHIFIHFFSHVDIVRSRADYVSDKKAMEKRLSSMNTLLTKTCAQALYFG